MPRATVAPQSMHPAAEHRSAAIAIAVASLLSLALIAHHPTAGRDTVAERLAEMAREATLSAVVHGSFLVLLATLLFGFLGFARALGWGLARVRAGFVAYALGFVAMIGAATVSGFVVPRLAAELVGEPPARLEAAVPVFDLCWFTNQALAEIGTSAISAAILLWSLVLLGREGADRWIGGGGVLVALVPALALVSGHLQLHLHGMAAVLLAQTLWNLAVAWWLLREAGSPRGS